MQPNHNKTAKHIKLRVAENLINKNHTLSSGVSTSRLEVQVGLKGNSNNKKEFNTCIFYKTYSIHYPTLYNMNKAFLFFTLLILLIFHLNNAKI